MDVKITNGWKKGNITDKLSNFGIVESYLWHICENSQWTTMKTGDLILWDSFCMLCDNIHRLLMLFIDETLSPVVLIHTPGFWSTHRGTICLCLFWVQDTPGATALWIYLNFLFIENIVRKISFGRDEWISFFCKMNINSTMIAESHPWSHMYIHSKWVWLHWKLKKIHLSDWGVRDINLLRTMILLECTWNVLDIYSVTLKSLQPELEWGSPPHQKNLQLVIQDNRLI